MGKYLANEVDIDFKEDGKDYKEKIIFDDQKETTEYVVEKTARQGLIRVLADHKSVNISWIFKFIVLKHFLKDGFHLALTSGTDCITAVTSDKYEKVFIFSARYR